MPSALHRVGSSARWRQQGQAAVLALLLLGVAVLAGLAMYDSGRHAIGKMQLQNAADAATFSVSQLEARDLNFMAYTNRAMVANQVGLGQFVSLVSWANHIASIGDFLNLYASALAGPTLGWSTAIIGPVATGFRTVGQTAAKIVTGIYRVMSKIIGVANVIYSNAQNVYHYITVYLSLVALHDVIKRNDANASISPFGYLGVLAHEASYLGKFAKRHAATSGGAADLAAFGSFAATVQASRDPFLASRSWTKRLNLINLRAGFIRLRISLNLNRRGGGELRFMSSTRGDRFNWSGADTTGMNVSLAFGLHIPLPWPLPDININFNAASPNLPFSAGTAQIGRFGLNFLNMQAKNAGGKLPSNRYGDAPTILTAWNAPGLGVPYRIQVNNIDRSYKGLNSYTSVAPYEEDQGFLAPYFLLGLTKASGKLAPQAIKTSGRFQMPDGQAAGTMATLSKSEVYFARPNDVSYFARSDRKVELGNTYNPYWQARLVDTTFTDRTLALLLQQRQVWVPGLREPRLPSSQDLCGLIKKAGLKC